MWRCQLLPEQRAVMDLWAELLKERRRAARSFGQTLNGEDARRRSLQVSVFPRRSALAYLATGADIGPCERAPSPRRHN